MFALWVSSHHSTPILEQAKRSSSREYRPVSSLSNHCGHPVSVRRVRGTGTRARTPALGFSRRLDRSLWVVVIAHMIVHTMLEIHTGSPGRHGIPESKHLGNPWDNRRGTQTDCSSSICLYLSEGPSETSRVLPLSIPQFYRRVSFWFKPSAISSLVPCIRQVA